MYSIDIPHLLCALNATPNGMLKKIDLKDSTSYVECKCGNLSITRKESEPPSKISYYINVGYSTSIPVITEYLDKTKIRDLEDDKPQKKLGFS